MVTRWSAKPESNLSHVGSNPTASVIFVLRRVSLNGKAAVLKTADG